MVAKMTPNSLDLLSQYAEQMLETLEWLSSYGADPEGGVTRLLIYGAVAAGAASTYPEDAASWG